MAFDVTKALRKEIQQDITCRIHLLEYLPNSTVGVNDGAYSVYKLEGQSGVNMPYSFTLHFISDESIRVEEIVDTNAQIILQDKKDVTGKKSICGKIYEAKEDSVVGGKFMYEVTVVSPLYYLGLNTGYEIFMQKRTSDIISEIINRYASLLNININVKIDLKKEPIREYTTLYNQSDLDFIWMLCEEEGYSLLCDYSTNDSYTLTLCQLNDHAMVYDTTFVASYNSEKKFSPSHYITDYYDKDKPSLQMKTHKGQSISSETLKDNTFTSQLRNDIKNYDLKDKLNLLDESLYKDLNRYSQNDTLRAYANGINIQGHTKELNICDAMMVSLHDEKALKNMDVITTTVTYSAQFHNALDEFVQEDIGVLQFFATFDAIPKAITYQPPKRTPKPKIHGVHSAIVSNSQENLPEHANEIDVDEQGRVRVVFHFEPNHLTSTYLRVSNLYSGNQYGSQFIPRVNSEVLVSFINGNPDLPIIIGSVHNGENQNPYPLPQSKTKSFIKTASYPAYSDQQGYNEIAFEDKNSAEQLSLRAQRDYQLTAQDSSYTHIENSSTTFIDHDEEHDIKHYYEHTTGNDANREIKGNDIKTVEQEEVHTIQENKQLHVNKDFNTIVKNNHNTYIEQDMITSVKNVLHEYIQGDVSDKYLENLFIQVGLEMGVDISETFQLDTTSVLQQAAQMAEVEATDGITLRCGAHSLTIQSDGIHFNTSNFVDNSSNGGVNAPEVPKILIEKLKKEYSLENLTFSY